MRHQADAEDDRQRAERRGERQDAAAHLREREQPADRRGHGASLVTAALPPSSETTRSTCSDELGPVRDEQHRPPGAQPLARLGHDRGAGPVEVGRRLVEDDERRLPQERPGERDATALARRERAAAVADDRRRSRRAAPRRSGRPRRARLPRARRRSVAPGRPRRMLSATVAAEDRRLLRHPREVRAPDVGPADGEIVTADGHTAGVGSTKPRSRRPRCSCRPRSPRPARRSRRARARGRARRARAPGATGSANETASSRTGASRGSGRAAAAAPSRRGGGARAGRASARRPRRRPRWHGTGARAAARAGRARGRGRARSARPGARGRRRRAARRR